MSRYTMDRWATPFGVQYRVTGPGMSSSAVFFPLQPLTPEQSTSLDFGLGDHTDTPMTRADFEAERVRRLLTSAFDAGIEEGKREVRAALGLAPDRP